MLHASMCTSSQLVSRAASIQQQRSCAAAAVAAAAAWPSSRRSRQRSSQPPQSSAAAAEASPSPASSSIYDRPQLYDDAFSYRDFQAEAKFLLGAFQRHAQTESAGKLRSVLELGCGPANHAIQLAKHGVQAWALDSNAHMLQFAAAKAAAAGADLTTVQGDMTSLQVQVGLGVGGNIQPGRRGAGIGRVRASLSGLVCAAPGLPHWHLMLCQKQGMSGRFDMVACLLGTLSHCLDNKQAAAAFAAAAQHLRPGGLFLIELAHPGLWCWLMRETRRSSSRSSGCIGLEAAARASQPVE
jgi:SAM-dependent methyltransferase